jgi:hypothetical protein
MKTPIVVLLAGLALGAGPAAERAPDELRVALPESHELVELQPGLQVIPEFDLEVFFTGGTYWLRADGGWYAARRPAPSTTFALAEARSVPAALARLPVGSHLNYRPAPGQKRSTKLLSTMEPPEREAEVDAGPVKVEPSVTRPAAPAPPEPPKAAPAKVPPAKAAPAKPAPAPKKIPPKPLPPKKK